MAKMNMRFVFTATYAILIVLLCSCSKESETFATPTLNDYYPLQTGRAYIYRLDSTITASFGTALIVHSYQAKDTIESTFSDNQGRLSYRIFRFIRDTAAIQPWRFAATYVATPTEVSVEYVDNNLRFLKLHLPIRNGYTFKAHSYIDTKSLLSTVSYLDEWEYEYDGLGEPYSVLNKTYNETVRVLQHDETSPDIPFTPSVAYQQRNYSIEVYAKGVGLVYKEFLHWIWDANPPPSNYDDNSYGVRLRLITNY